MAGNRNRIVPVEVIREEDARDFIKQAATHLHKVHLVRQETGCPASCLIAD